MKGKATIIKVSQEGSRNDGTDPGEGAGIWKGGSLWELQPPGFLQGSTGGEGWGRLKAAIR